MNTRVVNLKIGTMFDVYIGRKGHGEDGYFGNPFKTPNNRAPDLNERYRLIKSFEEYFYRRLNHDLVFQARVIALDGLVLGCFCKPLPCHGDVIAEWLNMDPRARLAKLIQMDPR